MNNYHRFINLPFDVPKPERFNHPADIFINYMGHEVVPAEMFPWLESLGLTLSNIVEGFYSGPNKGRKINVPVHNDQTTKPGEFDAVKINMTWGPQDSVTQWWNLKETGRLQEIRHDHNIVNQGFKAAGITPDINCYRCWTANPNDLEFAFEKTITGPSLLNVGQLHSVKNPSKDQMRWTLSFTPLKDKRPLLFTEAIEVFEPWLTE
jgi:hypothetical protein